MTGGNAFFTDAERKQFREVEGFCPPDDEPRLNDPPKVGKFCGDCDCFDSLPPDCGICDRSGEAVNPDDEACEECSHD